MERVRALVFAAVVCILILVQVTAGYKYKIPIGLIFDERSPTLERSVLQHLREHSDNNNYFTLETQVHRLDTSDSYNVSRALCSLLSGGAVTIIGDIRPQALDTVIDYADDTQIPFIFLNNPADPKRWSDDRRSMQVYMEPSLTKAIVGMVYTWYRWRRFYYIYDQLDSITRIEQTHDFLHEFPRDYRYATPDVQPHRVDGAHQCLRLLLDIFENNRGEDVRVVLDIPPEDTQWVITQLVEDKDIHKIRFHFIIPYLSLRSIFLESFITGGVNITGFEIFEEGKSLQYRRKNPNTIKVRDHIAADTAQLLEQSLMMLQRHQGSASVFGNVNGWQLSQEMTCLPQLRWRWRYGRALAKVFQNTTFHGRSGYVQFDSTGQRTELSVEVQEVTMYRGLTIVGTWDKDGFQAHGEEQVLDKANRTIDNRTRIVTSIDEEPYLMKVVAPIQGLPVTGRHRFEGYCSDLAELVAENVGYDYHIRFVKDGEYGKKEPDGTWNGVIGELTRHEADIAIAPLTITSDREKVLDFTKPFMSLGISLMIKKPVDTDPHVFSFMQPLSREIWLCTVFAFIGVSVVLFLVSRFSSEEWQLDSDSKLENDFTIGNSLWFSLGAFMQQGCDVLPKSVSGRIVTSVWWFFTLIIISSYTANLAAFLTTMRMSGSIRSAEDLVKQTEIKYGPYRGGSTYMFFNQTTVSLYQRMWSFMTSQPDVFVENNDKGIDRVRDSHGKYVFLIESTLNEYYSSRYPCNTMKAGSNLNSKGYGIATPMGSDIRDKLTLAILQLREDGVLDELKKTWWVEKSQCPLESSAKDTDASLTLSKVAGIFYILVAGLALSVFSVILEFLYKTKVDSRKQNVSFGSEARSKFRLSISGHSEDDPNEQRTPLRSTTTTFTTAHSPLDEGTSLCKTQTLV
ncbi:glutamate receptor 1 precursor [Aplysia californica]|uniref:Glutamate receptor 1 n=1 Tax=Aplysia californica TaxID=6500 RepID=Q38JW0_APLCA|nr:glutamate receptor 1 precursor [Aplysia californica]ABB03887.1 glutamate receptor 1 [Aplysia californica]